MLFNILRQCSPSELEAMDEAELPQEVKDKLKQTPAAELDPSMTKVQRRLQLKNKIQSVGRMNLMLTNMRKNQEVLLELKSMSPDGKLPKGALLEAKPTIEFASQQYAVVKTLDA